MHPTNEVKQSFQLSPPTVYHTIEEEWKMQKVPKKNSRNINEHMWPRAYVYVGQEPHQIYFIFYISSFHYLTLLTVYTRSIALLLGRCLHKSF